MTNDKVALVTGANQGIGYQIAKDLAARGFLVLVGSRALERGQRAAKELGPNAHPLQLDVTDATSIAAAAEHIRKAYERLDVLVNNAGIAHTGKLGTDLLTIVEASRPSRAPLDEIRAVFETNVVGVVAVTQSVLPMLRESPAGRIVNVSSTAGSLTINSDPSFEHRLAFAAVYSPSKAALNAMTVAMAIELEGTRIKVNAMCPGFTKTAFNRYAGTGSVEDGARRAVELAILDENGPTGTFSNNDGPLPW